MKWSPQQDTALQRIEAWRKDPDAPQVFYLAGYAGTGKTTLAKTVAEGSDGFVPFCAFTGKAASVLQRKGCLGASTIHSLIYRSSEKSKKALRELEDALLARMAAVKQELGERWSQQLQDDDRIVSELRRKLEIERSNVARPAFMLNPDSDLCDADFAIVDECSMVDGRMGQDLLSFGKKILVLGDPAQLPPVMGEGFFTSAEPDFMLTEIHRQASENPIIAMATIVREGGTLQLGRYGSSLVTADRLDPQDVLTYGQILVGKNATRHAVNARVRQLKDINDTYPQLGERLVCLRNEHDKGLLNGTLWSVTDVGVHDASADSIFMTVKPEDGGEEQGVECHSQHFDGRKLEFYERKEKSEFAFGYALTCHKAQGSEWPSVLVFDESATFKEDRRKWLYTAITRAAERVTISRK